LSKLCIVIGDHSHEIALWESFTANARNSIPKSVVFGDSEKFSWEISDFFPIPNEGTEADSKKLEELIDFSKHNFNSRKEPIKTYLLRPQSDADKLLLIETK
jgi:hypothetical protein